MSSLSSPGGRIAIVQSNYIPWKGYFDLIAAVDEFVLYDDVQFTKNDWRNRNRIKTPQGVQWLSVPVGQRIDRRIRDVLLPDPRWQVQHWKSLESNYRRAPGFADTAGWLAPLYLDRRHETLSALNRCFIEAICTRLGIRTRITDSSSYQLTGDRSERVAGICAQAGANHYVSGPTAKSYLDEEVFAQHGLAVSWFDYSGYPTYPQPWGVFAHDVTVLDLLFSCGSDAARYLKFGRDPGQIERAA
jgi:WbqC-like protein family